MTGTVRYQNRIDMKSCGIVLIQKVVRLKKITSKLSKEKTFPEENYTFEGHIDGKEVEGTLTTGTSPFKMISAKEFDVKLSPVEKVVGLAHMESHF